ncbi:hypothetical protein ABDK10_05465 [Staphylococcus aureus]
MKQTKHRSNTHENKSKPHNTKTNYILTMHARERFKERVSNNGKSNTQAIVKWLKRALNEGYKVSENNDGDVCYRYGKYLVVMNDRTLITISYYKRQDVKPLKEDLNKIIARRLRKEIKELVKHRKDTLIKASEVDIERLKSLSVPKQKRLYDEREDLLKEAAEIKNQTKSIVDLANRYGIEKVDIVLDSDLL